MTLETSDAAMDVDNTQTVQQEAMDDVQTSGPPDNDPLPTVCERQDQDMSDAPQEKPTLGSDRSVPSLGNNAPASTPPVSKPTGWIFTPLKSTGISSLFASAPSASPRFSSKEIVA
jgi:hypothetical protein